uniref:DNA-directed RNA polymerase III subunit RPC9 n=1 Tax=Brassica campestris TaxID=3711 RepID=A0A3P5Y512_BRACM|nr:unnamed protein product [Brassica rapa]
MRGALPNWGLTKGKGNWFHALVSSPASRHDQKNYIPTSFFDHHQKNITYLFSPIKSHKTVRMKANAGTLTNFEVLDLLNSRGASNDTTRVIAPISTSEYTRLHVYDYLMETPACTQTLEIITNFSDQCKYFKLAKAEILNIINTRPSSTVNLAPILEEPSERGIDKKAKEGILKLVEALLPPPPIVEARGENEEEETEEGEQS